MSTTIVENSDSVEHAAAILGEYSENYVILCVNPEYGNAVEIRTPNTISAHGLLGIGLAYVSQFNKLEDDCIDFEWEEAEDEDDESTMQ